MNNLYIAPAANGESNALPEFLSRVNIRYVEIESLHELWPHVVDGADVVVRIQEAALTVLIRHMSTLLGTPPTRIDSAPGSKYSYEWNVATANLHSEVWETLEGKFAKSGLIGNTTTEVEERSKLSPQGHKTEASDSLRRSRRREAKGPENEASPTSHIQLDELDNDVGMTELLT
jgi:hypothetical protein